MAVKIATLDKGLVALVFRTTNPQELRGQIEGGAVRAKRAIDAFSTALDLSLEEIARMLGASPRTMERRLKNGAALDMSEGDRAYRLARVADLAVDALGDASAAKRWLRAPSQYFGGATPFEMLLTEVGAHAVEQSLYAIAYGAVG